MKQTNILFLKSTQTVKFLVIEVSTYRLIQIVWWANVKLFALKQRRDNKHHQEHQNATSAPLHRFHGIQFFSLFADCRVTCQVFPSHLIWHEAGQKADANYGCLA